MIVFFAARTRESHVYPEPRERPMCSPGTPVTHAEKAGLKYFVSFELEEIPSRRPLRCIMDICAKSAGEFHRGPVPWPALLRKRRKEKTFLGSPTDRTDKHKEGACTVVEQSRASQAVCIKMPVHPAVELLHAPLRTRSKPSLISCAGARA